MYMATNPRSTQELFQANPKKRNLTVSTLWNRMENMKRNTRIRHPNHKDMIKLNGRIMS